MTFVFARAARVVLAMLAAGCTDAPQVPLVEKRPVAELARVAPPDEDLSIMVPANFGALSTKQVARLRTAAQSVDPDAFPDVYGRMGPDGEGLGAILRLNGSVRGERLSLVEVAERLRSDVAVQLDGAATVEITRDPARRYVELFLDTGTGREVIWGRLRLWVTESGELMQRGCVCAGAVCEQVRRSCRLPQPEDAVFVDEPLRGPVETLRAGAGEHIVEAEVPRAWEAIPTDVAATIVEREKREYATLVELEVVGAAPREGSGTAFVQAARWCGRESHRCTVATVATAIEASARAHGERLGEPHKIRRTPAVETGALTLEIRLGTNTWEHRRLIPTEPGVRELSCLCTANACPELERSCSLASPP